MTRAWFLLVALTACGSNYCDDVGPIVVMLTMDATAPNNTAAADMTTEFTIGLVRKIGEEPEHEHGTRCIEEPVTGGTVTVQPRDLAAGTLPEVMPGTYRGTIQGYASAFDITVDSSVGGHSETLEAPGVFAMNVVTQGPDVVVHWDPSHDSRIQTATTVLLPNGDYAVWRRTNDPDLDTGTEVIPASVFTMPGTYRISVIRSFLDQPFHGLAIYFDHAVPTP